MLFEKLYSTTSQEGNRNSKELGRSRYSEAYREEEKIGYCLAKEGKTVLGIHQQEIHCFILPSAKVIFLKLIQKHQSLSCNSYWILLPTLVF